MNLNRIQHYAVKRFIILTVCLIFLIMVTYNIANSFRGSWQNDYEKRVEVNLRNFSPNGTVISGSADFTTLHKMKTLKSYYPDGDISYMSQMDIVLQSKDKTCPVREILSGGNVDRFDGLHMLRGSFFNSSQLEYRSKAAVISDTLAHKLFMNLDVLGNQVNLSGIKYKIVGVYKKNRSVLATFSSDGVERVYVPYGSVSDYDKIPVKTVFIKSRTLEEKAFRAHYAEENMRKAHINPGQYEIKDFYNSPIYVSQPLSAFVFLIGVLCLISIFKFLIKFLQFGAMRARSCLQSMYYAEFMVRKSGKILFFLAGGLLMMVVSGAVVYFIRFRGAVPYEYIPADNIFDFNFYANKIKEAVFKANTPGHIPTQMEGFLASNLKCTYILITLLFINLISIGSSLKLYRSVSESFYSQALAVAVSLPTGIILGSIACLACGMEYTIPVRHITIIVLFLFLQLLDTEVIFSSEGSFPKYEQA